MANRVDPNTIESIVGARRMPCAHLGRAVSSEQRVYILHSRQCLHSTNIQRCWYTLALDTGINADVWAGWEDQAVMLGISRSLGLVPLMEVVDP